MATETIDETMTDAFMPDPEKLKVAQAQPVNLKVPTPDPDDDVELELEDDGKGENEDDEPKDEAEGEDEEDDSEDEEWDKERQKRDEEDAKSGRGKADLLNQNEQLQTSLQAMEKRLTELAEKVSAPQAEETPAEDEDELSGWEDLPEEDDITGEELPENKRMNAYMKAMQQQNASMRKQMEEFMAAQEARQEQAANQDAYQGILRKAASSHGVKVNDLNDRVRQEWSRRGYSNDHYPDEHQTEDAVYRIAQTMEIESLKSNQQEAKRKSKQPPATDKGKGGKTKVKHNAHTIFPDFKGWLKGATKRGEFADVQGR